MKTKKKILILYASAGEGHKTSAFSLDKEFRKHDNYEVITRDGLSFSSKFFRFLYADGYIILVKHVVFIWGLFFNMLDIKWINTLNKPLRHFVNKLAFRKLLTFIDDEQPDVIISTHFMPNELLSNIPRKIPLISCVTDYKVHWFWITKFVDKYCVGTEATKVHLLERGVEEEKIIITGIPIDEKFHVEIEKETIRTSLELSPDIFTVLIVGGGYGVGPLEHLVNSISTDFSSVKLQLVVVCGKNAKLKEKLNSKTYPDNITVHILGFTSDIDKYMSASDLMISKAGGLLLSESFAKGISCIMLAPILGQETSNADIFEEMNFAKRADTVKQAIALLKQMLEDSTMMSQIKTTIKQNKKKPSAIQLVDIVENLE